MNSRSSGELLKICDIISTDMEKHEAEDPVFPYFSKNVDRNLML